jgi:hypothetical protein
MTDLVGACMKRRRRDGEVGFALRSRLSRRHAGGIDAMAARRPNRSRRQVQPKHHIHHSSTIAVLDWSHKNSAKRAIGRSDYHVHQRCERIT